MIDKADELINKGNSSAAQKTLDEIQRLDGLYLVKTS
jgi:soluble cytochrome b562